MSLRQRIEDDLLTAIKSQQETERTLLRGLKSAIKNREIELGTGELPDNEIEQVIAREVKRRRESIEAYQQASKPELADQEKIELELLQQYLPEQLGSDEVTAIIEKTIEELGDQANTGMVMGKLSAILRGKADMKEVSRMVNEQLSKK